MGDPAVIDRRSSAQFVHRTWPARPRQWAPLRAEVRRWLAPLDLTGQAEDDLVPAVSEAVSNCVEHAYSRPTAENIVELTFWPEPHAVGPDHRPRRVVHCVRSTQPTGQGNRDATAHRVRSDPPRHSGNTGVPASSVAGRRLGRVATHAQRLLMTGQRDDGHHRDRSGGRGDPRHGPCGRARGRSIDVRPGTEPDGTGCGFRPDRRAR